MAAKYSPSEYSLYFPIAATGDRPQRVDPSMESLLSASGSGRPVVDRYNRNTSFES
jgi:hypothetical protein